jgi:hypothetical protein
MKNSPYLDQPTISLAVALRSMLANTEVKIATAAPAEKERLQQRAQVFARVAYAEINNPALDLDRIGPNCRAQRCSLAAPRRAKPAGFTAEQRKILRKAPLTYWRAGKDRVIGQCGRSRTVRA